MKKDILTEKTYHNLAVFMILSIMAWLFFGFNNVYADTTVDLTSAVKTNNVIGDTSVNFPYNIVGLPDGKTGVLYTDNISNYYKVVDANGSEVFSKDIGALTGIFTGDTLYGYALSGGKTVITFENSSWNSEQFRFIILNSDGSLEKGLTDISNSTLGGYNMYTGAAELSNGNIAFMWQDTGDGYLLSIFDASGNVVKTPTSIDKTGTREGLSSYSSSYTHSIAANKNGTFMITYNTNNSDKYYGVLYDNTGTQKMVNGYNHFIVSNTTKSGGAWSQVVSLLDNTFGVLYYTSTGIAIKTFNDNGSTAVAEVTSGLSYQDGYPSLVSLTGGGYLVYDMDSTGLYYYAREFNNGGNLIKDWTKLDHDPMQYYGNFCSGYDSGFAMLNDDTGNLSLYGITAPIAVTSVNLNKSTMTLTVGDAAESLTAIVNPNDASNKDISWDSDNTAVATVVDGVVTPVGVGTANIRVTTADGSKTATCVVTVNASPIAVTTYTLTYTSGTNGATTGSGIQVVSIGGSGTPVTAVANTGYHFVSWSDGVTTATRTDSDIAGDISVTANFAVTSSSSGGSSSSSGGNTSTTKTTTTIQAEVIDTKTEQSVKSVEAQVTVETNGTKTVTVKLSGVVGVRQEGSTMSAITDLSKLGFSTPVTTSGTIITGTTQSVSLIVATDGTLSVKGLENNTESKFDVTYDLGNGQKIIIGSMDVKVSSTGVATLTSTLVDPYGTITDEATGKAIDGVNVTLYYANTDRNKAAGKTPGAVVPLTSIDGFKPNNNKNPQVSDASGDYGFMVFPTSDYYIVGTKDGYMNYTSPTISVEQEIVKWNFAMHINGTERLAGNSRMDTAIAIAKATYSNTLSNVILATSENYADALSGSVLAYKLNAPILLVGTSTEDQEIVLAYLKANMNSKGKVYILGGHGAVSTNTEEKITALGFKNIIRLGGVDRYETAVKIADTVGAKEGTPIVIVSGESYADALSVSSTAAVNQYPIFIVSKDGLSDLVKKEISTIKPRKVFIIGSQGAVSTTVEDEIYQIGTVDKGNTVRIGGSNRFETSLAVTKYFNLTGTISCIATGNDFPDALAGSIYAAKNNAHIILVDKALTDSEIIYLQSEKISGITIFGGESVVSNYVEQQLNKILGK